MKSEIHNQKFKIVIVGAGPAGASAAVWLAEKGFSVTLVEREQFPRHKLCGEFISPECFEHFKELGVLEKMFSGGGDRISETVFYAPDGKSVNVPSKWFNNAGAALGLSRAAMDLQLLERAKEIGVKVLEETNAVGLLWEKGEVCGIRAKNKHESFEIPADLTIDATGRARILGKLAEREKSKISDENFRKSNPKKPQTELKNRLVGFKTHLENADIAHGRCEIYFFRGGYGGLNLVENNLANHCFLIDSNIVKDFSGDAEKIVREVIFKNKRAFETMRNASPVFDWLAVSIESFGAKDLNPAQNLLAIGDAGAFIDPFTGSGMLMALESGKILAHAVGNADFSVPQITKTYQKAHHENFRKRLRLCRFLRHAAFSPKLAKIIIPTLGFSNFVVKIVAKATRSRASTLSK